MNDQTELMQPVAPPDLKNPSPVGGAIAPAEPIEINLHTAYEQAVENGDPKSMYSLSQRAKGTPYERVIRGSAETMQKYSSEIENAAKPVVEAGGINSPKGRLEFQKQVEFAQEEPQKMRAFVELLLGNPKWRTFVTGGTPTTSIGYDANGKQLERTVNELGKPIEVIDSETGQKLTRQQLAERGGFLPSLENALGFQRQKEISKFNTEAFNQANAAVNAYAAKAPELKQSFVEMRERLQKALSASELTADQRAAIGSFTSRSMGYAQSLSEGMNALRQKVDNKNASLSRAEQSALGSVLKALGWQMDASGSVTKKNGEAVTKSELDQAQNNLSNSNQFERNFNQNKEDFIRSEVFKGLSAGEMKNLGRALDLQGMIEKTMLELSAKHGTLPFLINPKTYQIGDEGARGEALALIGEFNQDATEAFNNWRNRQLESYKRTGTVPNAGELEAAFTKTAEYRSLREEYAQRNKELLRRPAVTRPETEPVSQQWSLDVGLGNAPQEKPGVIRNKIKEKTGGESSIPSNYKLIGKTPDGKNVYRTPQNKQVVEQ